MELFGSSFILNMFTHTGDFDQAGFAVFHILYIPLRKIKTNMSRKSLPSYENVTVEAVAAEGKCVAHIDDMVIFIPFVVPGDVVDLQVVKKRSKYCEARVTRFVKQSDIRIAPMCQHFGICGGCKWQNLPYEEQLKAKQQQVFDQLTRIGKVELPEFNPILGSAKIKEYRNKLEFGCADKRWHTSDELKALPEDAGLGQPAIGFHITGAFDKIYPIEKCWLMDGLHNDIRNAIYEYAVRNGLTFYNAREHHGLLRNIMFRNSNTGEWMVLIQFHYDEDGDENKAKALLEYISDKFSEISSLIYTDNQKGNDTIGDLNLIIYKGTDAIFETMEDLKFKVGPKSFYQTNTEQAYHLYSVAREFCFDDTVENITDGEDRKPLVYDLYTGTGTIANFVAARARKVIGIEYVPEAIEDAKMNSKINGIENTEFFAGDMKDILTDSFIQQHGRPDIIITDPPRAGMHPDVIRVILNAAPKRIVYVSCNPATQARDLALLNEAYKVFKVQPVDMFPHTPHVENVVQLVRTL